jgi:hypothetical protein
VRSVEPRDHLQDDQDRERRDFHVPIGAGDQLGVAQCEVEAEQAQLSVTTRCDDAGRNQLRSRRNEVDHLVAVPPSPRMLGVRRPVVRAKECFDTHIVGDDREVYVIGRPRQRQMVKDGRRPYDHRALARIHEPAEQKGLGGTHVKRHSGSPSRKRS